MYDVDESWENQQKTGGESEGHKAVSGELGAITGFGILAEDASKYSRFSNSLYTQYMSLIHHICERSEFCA